MPQIVNRRISGNTDTNGNINIPLVDGNISYTTNEYVIIGVAITEPLYAAWMIATSGRGFFLKIITNTKSNEPYYGEVKGVAFYLKRT